jgi:3-hydroxyisobutyrate dehydrogenase-like beta-hydroxyacid dehydrogenase
MDVALIGYGEVGRILAEDLRAAGHRITAYDLRLHETEGGDAMRTHARPLEVALAASHGEAVERAELVVCAVTASETVAAATACAGALRAGGFFLDLNSASPGAKVDAAGQIGRGRGGGRYVEGAVMTSVPPHRIKVPLLLGGPHALAALPILQRLGFVPRLASSQLGVASATKMCRSVIIKGLEALAIESLTAARHYGVEDAVLASLAETFPGIAWEEQTTYFFQRVIAHGRRRAEELREVAVTMREAGFTSSAASGAAERQGWVADLADQGLFGQRGTADFARSEDWRIEADRILDHLARPQQK